MQPSCIVLEIANVRSILHVKQDHDVTDQEKISDNDSEKTGKSTWSSNIEDHNLVIQQEVIHLAQKCHDEMK
jgi:hypothetical protein